MKLMKTVQNRSQEVKTSPLLFYVNYTPQISLLLYTIYDLFIINEKTRSVTVVVVTVVVIGKP